MKYRAVPKIPQGLDREVGAILNALKENAEILSGVRSTSISLLNANTVTLSDIANKVNEIVVKLQGGDSPKTLSAAALPAFDAYAISAQSVGTTFSRLNYAGVNFNAGNAYDPLTNFRFTPQVAGYYQVNGMVNVAATGSHICAIFKNGSEHKRGTQLGGGIGTGVSSIVQFNGTSDYIELWGIFGSATTVNTVSWQSYFNASFVAPF